ncbi:MAG: hypothetical protein K1X88_30775 [Nannocystaceae bacterium]|nr:hypothetical protein [Nannocystaceae bacterium]
MDNAAIEVVHDRPRQLLALWRCFVVVVVRSSPNGEDVLALEQALAELRARGHDHAAIIHCSVANGPGAPPDDGARARYRTMMQDRATIVRASAIVIEQEGFVGSLIRSVLTSLLFLTRAVYPTRAHASMRDAADWLAVTLAAHDCRPATSDELVAAMSAAVARARGGAHEPPRRGGAG